MNKIIIIGAGPAGMMAAGIAAKNESEVILIEKNNKPGMKLSITGKGKCNLTNSEPKISTFVDKYGKKGKFLINCFHEFFNIDLIEFFSNQGCKLKEFSGGRIYPKSLQANEIVKSLVEFVKANGVIIHSNEKALKLIFDHNTVSGILTDKNKYFCDAVVIATGGLSYPSTGSTGYGYKLAKQAGHSITPILPSLVPLKILNPSKRLVDLKLKNVKVTIYKDKNKLAEAFGEFVFKDFGVDGSVVLELSRKLNSILSRNNKLKMSIDLKPALTEDKLDRRIIREIKNNSKGEYKTLLRKLLPKKLIKDFQLKTCISERKKVATITKTERARIIKFLKNYQLEILGTEDIDKAIVTSGGVNLDEIDPRTMQSKITKNLFFAGEVIDIDGATGGYNLQAAFSTGHVAGYSATKSNT